ncbi:hypothetical protein ScPMuIL_009986 [Solemya velum]
MSTFWRQVGLNYVQYSSVCAQVVRRCLKPELRVDALKREETHVKAIQWEGGKAVKEPTIIKQISPKT